tara:strand:- start:9 stop:593 length:585 start_codon:yes stop_codon:yes gene_type:complete
MGLWGATDADEAKPKFLTSDQKDEIQATSSGWVIEAGSSMTGNGNTSAQKEVLVAIRGLATKIGQATVDSVDWNITTFDKSEGGTLSLTVRYNEAVTVTGSPTVAVTNGNEGTGTGRGPHTLTYASGSGTNELIFTLAIGAANAATNADDVLTVGAQNIALAGGTLVDTIGGGNAEVAISASQGTACGSITVVA